MKVDSYNKLNSHYKKIYPDYLNKITRILNKYHKKQYNTDYWEPIVGLYLRRFIAKYLFQKKTKKKNLDKIASYKNVNLNKNYNDFADGDETYFYKLKNLNSSDYFKIDKINFFLRVMNTLRTIVPNILIKLGITKIFFQESYFKKNLRNFFSLRSFFNLISLPKLDCENYRIDKKKIFQNRLDLIDRYEINNKKDFFLRNVIISMPINYIENYNIIFNEVKKIYVSDAIYVDGNEVKFDFIKFYIAELILRKKKILIGQHALRTGLEDFNVYFDYSKSISNFYLTWGWKNNDKKNIKFYSTRIFSSLKKYKKIDIIKKDKSNICFVLCGFLNMEENICDNFIENHKAEKARIHLLEYINKVKGIKITLKPRQGSFIIKKKNNFYKKFKILRDDVRMYDVFGNYDVIIFERISLGIAECVYLNQPVIFYYPKNLYKQKNKKLNELLSSLKKANIYFDDKKQIMNLLNSKNDISKWWMNEKNVKNRNNFLNKFARTFKYNNFNEFKKLI